MVSEKIKLLDIIEKDCEIFDIDLEIKGQRKTYQISVIDSHGLFGLEFPTDLTVALREFPNRETQNLIAKIKKFYQSREKSSILQAA